MICCGNICVIPSKIGMYLPLSLSSFLLLKGRGGGDRRAWHFWLTGKCGNWELPMGLAKAVRPPLLPYSLGPFPSLPCVLIQEQSLMDLLNGKLLLLHSSLVLAPPVIPSSPAKEDTSWDPAEWKAVMAPSHGWQKRSSLKSTAGVYLSISTPLSMRLVAVLRGRDGENRDTV